MAAVKLIVLSDLAPNTPIEIEKAGSELPSKYYVDYVAEIKKKDPSFTTDLNASAADRYNSLQAYNEKQHPTPVTMTDSISQNGFRPQSKPEDPPMVLFFKVQTPPG